MKITHPFLVTGLLCLTLITGCKKEEGVGGTNSITGKVLVREYNSNFTVKTDQYYATDEDVYIVYGDETVYGDKVSTNYDGTFLFEYLREGNYKVFTYSKDSAGYPTKHMIPVIKNVSLSGRNKTVSAGTLVILK
jgi:hypothetical protein